MRRRTIFVAAPVVSVLLAAAHAAPAAAAGEAPFLMQDHGQVRVLRGLDPGQDFETAKLPEEIELAPAAGAPSAPSAPSSAAPTPPGASQPLAKTTRQRALDRVAEQGIRVTPAGGRSVSPRSGETRRRALERLRQRGSPAD